LMERAERIAFVELSDGHNELFRSGVQGLLRLSGRQAERSDRERCPSCASLYGSALESGRGSGRGNPTKRVTFRHSSPRFPSLAS
jgi:hypothetical protein